MKRWFFPIVSAILTVLLGFAASIAGLDPGLASYSHSALIVILIGGPLLVIVTIFLNRPPGLQPPPFDQSAFDNLKDIVDQAVQTTQLDPGLENEGDSWEDLLGSWKNAGKSLKIMSLHESEKGEESQILNENAARQLLRLTKGIMWAMLQRGLNKDLTELAPSAYRIAMKIHLEDDAALLAYGLAHAYYDMREIKDAEHWIDLMGKNKHTHPKPPDHTELQLRFLEMRGLIAREHNSAVEEKQYFNQALNIAKLLKGSATGAKQVRLSTIVATLQMRLAELTEAEDLDAAIDLYKAALASTTDPVVRIRCYDRLGSIAWASYHYDEAFNYHLQQFEASKKSGVQSKSIALEGMAKALAKKRLSRQDYSSDEKYEEAKKALMESAYYKLREALRLQEEKVSANTARANNLRIEIIEILDKIVPPKDYSSDIHSPSKYN